MAGVFDFLQGIFGGSKTTQQSQSTSTPTNVNPFTAMFTPQLAQMFQQGVPQYTGATNAPIGANEQAVLDQLMGSTGPNSANRSYLDDVISGKYLQPGSNPVLQQFIEAAQRPTMQGLEETLTRSLPGRFTQAGQFTQPGSSSAFDRAAAIATRGAAQAAGDIATNVTNNAYNTERAQQTAAAGLNQQEVQNTISNLQAQALPRMIQELGIERGLQLFQTNVQGILQMLQTLAGVTQVQVGNQSQSSATGESKSLTSPFAALTGGFGALFPKGLVSGGSVM